MTVPARAALECSLDNHVWNDEADAEGDTCNCGEWYRFADRIERSREALIERLGPRIPKELRHD